MDGCVFCDIVAGQAAAALVDEDDQTLAFLDHAPFTRGHTLVIPKRHHRDLWEADEDTAAAVMRASHRVARRLREVLEPDGCNVLQSSGIAAFQTVFHLHMQVIPRWDDDGMGIPSWPKHRADPEQLAEIASQLRRGG